MQKEILKALGINEESEMYVFVEKCKHQISKPRKMKGSELIPILEKVKITSNDQMLYDQGLKMLMISGYNYGNVPDEEGVVSFYETFYISEDIESLNITIENINSIQIQELQDRLEELIH